MSPVTSAETQVLGSDEVADASRFLDEVAVRLPGLFGAVLLLESIEVGRRQQLSELRVRHDRLGVIMDARATLAASVICFRILHHDAA